MFLGRFRGAFGQCLQQLLVSGGRCELGRRLRKAIPSWRLHESHSLRQMAATPHSRPTVRSDSRHTERGKEPCLVFGRLVPLRLLCCPSPASSAARMHAVKISFGPRPHCPLISVESGLTSASGGRPSRSASLSNYQRRPCSVLCQLWGCRQQRQKTGSVWTWFLDCGACSLGGLDSPYSVDIFLGHKGVNFCFPSSV